MIYLDSSVALAQLLAEDRTPPETLRQQPSAASRLPEYEVWNRLHARNLGRSHGEEARALESFPVPVRTLDALHLASVEFLRSRGQTVELASYDDRLLAAARALGVPLMAL